MAQINFKKPSDFKYISNFLVFSNEPIDAIPKDFDPDKNLVCNQSGKIEGAPIGWQEYVSLVCTACYNQADFMGKNEIIEKVTLESEAKQKGCEIESN